MIRPTCLAILVLLAADVAYAADRDHKTEVAQMAFLAQLAPKVCEDLQTNTEAVAAYMAAAEIDERQLLDDYGAVTGEAGKAFMDSASRDPAAACHQIWNKLGDDGLGLVTTGDD